MLQHKEHKQKHKTQVYTVCNKSESVQENTKRSNIGQCSEQCGRQKQQ